MAYSSYSVRLTWPFIVLSAGVAVAVHAQTTNSITPAAPPTFSSALAGYQPYTDEKIASWKQANDNTARIGGWRAYAREAAEPTPATSTTKPSKSQP